MLDADKGFVDNDASPLLPRRPSYLDVIEQHSQRAALEIKCMAMKARRDLDERCKSYLMSLGRTEEWVHRSWGQKARHGRAPRRLNSKGQPE